MAVAQRDADGARAAPPRGRLAKLPRQIGEQDARHRLVAIILDIETVLPIDGFVVADALAHHLSRGTLRPDQRGAKIGIFAGGAAMGDGVPVAQAEMIHGHDRINPSPDSRLHAATWISTIWG